MNQLLKTIGLGILCSVFIVANGTRITAQAEITSYVEHYTLESVDPNDPYTATIFQLAQSPFPGKITPSLQWGIFEGTSGIGAALQQQNKVFTNEGSFSLWTNWPMQENIACCTGDPQGRGRAYLLGNGPDPFLHTLDSQQVRGLLFCMHRSNNTSADSLFAITSSAGLHCLKQRR